MKTLINLLLAALITTLISCKNENAESNEKEQSPVTETGQHIGAASDSTTVDGPKGSMSNN